MALNIVNKTGLLKSSGQLGPIKGIVVHHTGGSSMSGAVTTLKNRGLSANYIVDVDGTVYRMLPEGAASGAMRTNPTYRSKTVGVGLTNKNTISIEVVGLDNKHILQAQRAAAQDFIREQSML